MKSAVSVSLALLLVSASLQPVCAQGPDGPIAGAIARESARVAAMPDAPRADRAWDRVRALYREKPLIVRTRDAASIRGRFVSADGSSITLATDDDRTRRIARNDVVQVLTDSSRSLGAHRVAFGALLGALAGGAVATLASHDPGTCRLECFSFAITMAGAGLGAGIGAGVGAAISTHPRDEVIYESSQIGSWDSGLGI
jgi:hypothetical protein